MALYAIHSAFIGTVRLLPTVMGVMVFRVYNKLLKELCSEYTCTTYFGAHLHCNQMIAFNHLFFTSEYGNQKFAGH